MAVDNGVGGKWSSSAATETDDTSFWWSSSMRVGSSDKECNNVYKYARSSGSCTLCYDLQERRWMQTFQLRINEVEAVSTLPSQTDQFRRLAKLSTLLRARSAKCKLNCLNLKWYLYWLIRPTFGYLLYSYSYQVLYDMIHRCGWMRWEQWRMQSICHLYQRTWQFHLYL